MLAIFQHLEQVIFQVKFANGFLYLDRCGRITNELISSESPWLLGDNVNPQGATLVSPDLDSILNFGSRSIDLAIKRDLDDEPISEERLQKFFSQIVETVELIADRLEVTEFSRIGFRCVFSIPKPSEDESKTFISNIGCVTLADPFIQDLQGNAVLEKCAFLFEKNDTSYRISMAYTHLLTSIRLGNATQQVRKNDFTRKQQESLNKKERAAAVAANARAKTIQDWASKPYRAIIDIDAFQEQFVNVNWHKFHFDAWEVIVETANKVSAGYGKTK